MIGRGSSRRGFARQRPRRRAEYFARRSAVAFTRWMSLSRVPRREAARRLGLNEATLGRWVRTWRCGAMRLEPRGRRVLRTRGELRKAILWQMMQLGPKVGLRVMREDFPDVPRAELEDLRRRAWRLDRRKRRHAVYVLRWKRPGAVRAMDHAQPPCDIEGRYDRLLLERDLASSMQLGALPVVGEAAAPVVASLKAHFRWYGIPLVLKSDNGSPLRSEEVKALCREYGVLMLFSPPATPSYNGACEAGVGSIKTRVHHRSSARDRPGIWTTDDIEAARLEANATSRPWGESGPTPDEVWQKRVPITDIERRMFLASYEAYARDERQARGLDPHAVLDHYMQAKIDRVAIVRALIEHDCLEFRRKRVAPPILRTKQCKIA